MKNLSDMTYKQKMNLFFDNFGSFNEKVCDLVGQYEKACEETPVIEGKRWDISKALEAQSWLGFK